MYSAIEAEVPVPSDSRTEQNVALMQRLKQAKKVCFLLFRICLD
jgi:hypothetical protein